MCSNSKVIKGDAPVLAAGKVITNCEVMKDTFLMWVECPEVAEKVKAGQFVMVSCGKDNLLRRPLSVHRVNEDKTSFALLYAKVGKGTEYLSALKNSASLDILGPLGNSFTVKVSAKKVTLIGGGMGIAPLCALADELKSKGIEVTLLLGARSEAQCCPSYLLPEGLKCVFATEDGSLGEKGMVTDYLGSSVKEADQIFICGPLPMYKALIKTGDFGGTDTQVSLEVRMACGFGVCYGCTIKTKQGLKQVCTDGPVFNLDDILWEELADI